MYRCLFAAAALLAGSSAARAQESFLTVDLYMDFERVADPQPSPDGSAVIYSRSHVNRKTDRWDSDLWIVDADGTRNRFLVAGQSARWSPDGSRIAYLAEADDGNTQLFVRYMDAEAATMQVTRVEHAPGAFRWSPDGRTIAFVMLVEEEETWPIDMPAAPEGAAWTPAPRIVRRTHYRQDRRGFLPDGFTHLFTVPSDGGTARQITRGKWNVGARFSGMNFGAGIDWTPDGEHVVFDGVMEEGEDVHYRESYIYAVHVASGKVRRLTERKGYWSDPAVSPDGRRVAFTGHAFTTQSYRAAPLHVVDFDGGEIRTLTAGMDRDAAQPYWAADGSGVYFTAQDHGQNNVRFVSVAGGVRAVTTGNHELTLTSVTPGGVMVGTRTSPHEPGDVVRIDPSSGTVESLTRVNEDVLHGVTLGAVEEIRYPSTDDTSVQGWIVKPPDFDASATYPLILHIHGGPHAMYNVGFSFAFQNFAANGFVVLYANPRGSTGYGTEFGNAIDNGYPSVDHEDLMAGVDAVMDRGFVDEHRLYVTGCSGGGVLASWAIAHTDRFAAAAVRCPVTNWISFAGTTDIVQWGYHRYDGWFWDNPEKWLHHSPLMHVGNVTTPTLLMTGELDLRTPITQTEEYFAALRTLGVPTALLRFHGEWHGTSSKPSNAVRTQLYLMDWFSTHPTATASRKRPR